MLIFLGGGGQEEVKFVCILSTSMYFDARFVMNVDTSLLLKNKHDITKLCELLTDIRYSQKETPGLFSWEFSCNQLAHRESIACNWL